MALTQQPPTIQHEKGAISAGAFALGDVYILKAATTPTDGTSGDGAGWASKGSLYIDTNGGKIYINTNTKASPTWTVVGAQTA